MAKAWWRDSDYALFDRLTKERDEARAEVAILTAALDERDLEAERGLEQYDRLVRERDEARASWEVCALHMHEARRERDEARAEVERLTDERDELLVRVANQDAELRATREAYNQARYELTRERMGIRPIDEVRSAAYRRGAEAMREACATACERAKYALTGGRESLSGAHNEGCDVAAEKIRAIPIPEEP
jgi:chromosome segregation ATPase